MSSSDHPGRHRGSENESLPQTGYSYKRIRFGTPFVVAMAAAVALWPAAAYAAPIPTSTTTATQTPVPKQIKPLSEILTVKPVVLFKPTAVVDTADLVERIPRPKKTETPAPPAPAPAKPTPPPAPPAPACNWIYPPHYWNDTQWANARTIYKVGVNRGISRDGEIIALMTAMQESQLYNLNYGDRDSLGLFQQRPSTGWGTPAQVTDPIYASNAFYNGLMRVPNWWNLAKTWAAQDVQISAFPYAYAKWETDATDMAADFANCG